MTPFEIDSIKMLMSALLFGLVATALLFDIRRRRIPNRLTLGAAVLGVAIQGLLAGSAGLVIAIGGLGVGFFVLLPGYLLHTTGAGDVKLMMAIGTFMGPTKALLIGFVSIIAGALIAVGFVAWTVMSGSAKTPWKRYRFMLRSMLTTGQLFYVPPEQGEVMGRKFPFAVAIAIGTTITLFLSWPEYGAPGLMRAISE